MPEQHETFFSVVDGRADRRSGTAPPARLDTDDTLIRAAAEAERPVWGREETPAGPVMYAALPVRIDGDSSRGVLVVAEFLGPAQARTWSTVLTMAAAGLIALAIAAAVGWFVAGRALTPIREVRETAARIDGSDLTRRIEVVGSDDAAQLAQTFNRMLDRVQAAFDGQRRFLDDAGHELRTPITVIRGHLELMGDDPQERAQTLRLVTDELERMSRLVDELILLARSESPGFLTTTAVDLTDLVVETLAKASAMAPRVWALDAVPEGAIRADGQRLTQALLQLAANAVAHTGEEDTIALGGEAGPARVRLWVRDTGPGIPETDQERIFERFARGPGPHHGPGSGLGLAIVTRIAEAHGGEVHVRSRPGEGAVFTVDLPRTEPAP
ncbi:sensor histidine kinase [Microbacterium sp. EF45047]|uniref:sensor histidine kinase n=1 Tax=Microbacterium sp. EF45047 TaxID=2809708 RepID=UPI002349F75B|nr:HAMP domain-containing sensor histidine kinase [Microbacterium sp. EF45047]WCM54863.1 HAMP domain-containing histidine kinase [Microbacterium sp. EF45047]